jgi:multidrug efflux pump
VRDDPQADAIEEKKNVVYRWFNKASTGSPHLSRPYRQRGAHAPRWMMVFVLVAVLAGFLFTPPADQLRARRGPGLHALAIVNCHRAPPCSAPKQVMDRGSRQAATQSARQGDIAGIFQIEGFSFVGRAKTSAWPSSS